MNLNILLLLLATSIWGFGFIATRWTLEAFDPIWANALRFSVAAIGSFPFLLYKNSFFRKNHILKQSFISSLFLLGILLFQTIGLSLTTVAKSGFITTLYTLFIPLISMVIFKKKFKPSFWFLVFLATFGMALMCNLEMKDLNLGDFFTLICSFSAAIHIIYIGKVANEIESAVEFNFLQNFFVAIISVPLAYFYKGSADFSTGFQNEMALWGFFYLGIISSMISFTVQVVAQKKIPDHVAGLIFLTESPFAAFFGFIFFKEALNSMNLLGALLIILSALLVPFMAKEIPNNSQNP